MTRLLGVIKVTFSYLRFILLSLVILLVVLNIAGICVRGNQECLSCRVLSQSLRFFELTSLILGRSKDAIIAGAE